MDVPKDNLRSLSLSKASNIYGVPKCNVVSEDLSSPYPSFMIKGRLAECHLEWVKLGLV